MDDGEQLPLKAELALFAFLAEAPGPQELPLPHTPEAASKTQLEHELPVRGSRDVEQLGFPILVDVRDRISNELPLQPTNELRHLPGGSPTVMELTSSSRDGPGLEEENVRRYALRRAIPARRHLSQIWGYLRIAMSGFNRTSLLALSKPSWNSEAFNRWKGAALVVGLPLKQVRSAPLCLLFPVADTYEHWQRQSAFRTGIVSVPGRPDAPTPLTWTFPDSPLTIPFKPSAWYSVFGNLADINNIRRLGDRLGRTLTPQSMGLGMLPSFAFQLSLVLETHHSNRVAINPFSQSLLGGFCLKCSVFGLPY